MPDLQTELSKIAHAWDTHEQDIRKPQPQQEKAVQTNSFVKTGNASHDTFTFIKRHAGCYTARDTAEILRTQGYKVASTSSLIAQMRRAGLVDLDDKGHLVPILDAYVPLNRLAPPAAKKRIVKKPKKAGLTALVPDTMTVSAVNTVTPQPATVWTADNVLKNIGVAEAAKLYAELGKLFGGK